jgi:hypothetical protein
MIVERVYEYNKTAYRNKVLLPNFLMVPILGYCLYRVIIVGTNIYLWAMGAIVCIYSLANAFLLKKNPRIITVSDDEIVFSSFGEKRFEISKLTKFRVRVTTPKYQVMIRLEDSDRRYGSFWVTYSQFNDKQDLIAEFDYLEKKVHPTSLRFKGRSGIGNKRPLPSAGQETAAMETVSEEAGNESDGD